MKTIPRVPLHEPSFAGREWDYLKECLDTGWVSSGGPFITRFEDALASRLGVSHAVAVVNGTAALHLGLIVLDVAAGDEVLVPSLTFIATANSVAYVGAVPRFVDSESSTLGMDPDALRDWLERHAELMPGGACRNRETGRRIAACVPMHVFGHPVRMELLLELCGRYGIAVMEDAAESLGSTRNGRAMGAFGRLSALSFNGNKIITTGGGGMVVTNDDALAARVRHLSTQAKKDPATYLHDEVGYNYRLTNLSAALGLAQLERLDDALARKRRIAEGYRKGLAGIPGVSLIWEPEGCRSNFWLNTVRAATPELAARLRATLDREGIETRPPWTPCHLQPVFRSESAGSCPRAEALWRECFNIPSSAHLPDEDVERTCRAIRKEACA
ncbi:MAG: LegC family aminotransferase [Elusimicrobiota bacterium]|jgi:perosamine synthetase